MKEIYIIQVSDGMYWGHGFSKNNIVDITDARLYKTKKKAEASKNKINELFNLNCYIRKVKFEIYD